MTIRRYLLATVFVLAGGALAQTAHAADPVLIAAGDIASCSSSGDTATAALLGSLTGTIITLGDNAYDSGTASEFTNCYGPTWGAFKTNTKPAVGNHEYNTANATGYFGYFGAAAGDPSQGYYSYEIGAWHLIVVNSNCSAIGGCGAGSPQEVWLRADLAAHPAACTLAYWHHPLFSSGLHGNQTYMRPIWQALYEGGADVILNGHDHLYERFGPQTPDAAADPAYGMREFVVGTGGRSHYVIQSPIANSESRNDDTYGVLAMTLHPAGYDWQFVPVAGATFSDSGSTNCHAAPASPAPSVGGVGEAPPVGPDADDRDDAAADQSDRGRWVWAAGITSGMLFLAGGGLVAFRNVRRGRRSRP